MTDTPIEPVAADPDALPRPEEEIADAGTGRGADDDVIDPQDQPAAGGSDDSPAAQGDGAADSW